MKKFPPPIYPDQPGTWAHSTVVKRLPEIARRALRENDFSKGAKDNLTELIDDIPDRPIRQLKDQGSPDQQAWESWIAPREGKSWLEVSWFFAEHYFYRRIMESVDYFQTGLDPFAFQKEQGLEKTRLDIDAYSTYFAGLGNNAPAKTLQGVIYFSLWGNQADLSLWPADSSENPKHSSQEKLRDHLLADDTDRVIQSIIKRSEPFGRLDILLDNAGFELVSDLGLADVFLKLNLAKQVVLHVKGHPTFVSDVIRIDVRNAVQFLRESAHSDTRSLGRRLEQALKGGELSLRDDFFWNSPLPMWELPKELNEDLREADLLISKGDANYRRLLGDREWDFTLPYNQVVDYLPVPLAALRTLKAELAVGLSLEQIQETYSQDPNWLVDGKWGVVHFSPGKD
jgi:uncharacterized protein with ATP-grasp and redox domains